MSRYVYSTLLLVAVIAEVSLYAAASSTGRTLLQPKTKLVAQPPSFIASLASACPPEEECFDLSINFSYDKAKRVVSDFIATSTLQYADPTGAGGFVGGACSAQAKTDGSPNPSFVITKAVPNGLKEVKAELHWSTQAVCSRGSLPAPPVPSGEKMLYYGSACEVMVYEWSSSKPGQYCNNRYVGRTYAEVNYDDKQPPNTKQAGKTQFWYCKSLTFIEGVCDNNCS